MNNAEFAQAFFAPKNVTESVPRKGETWLVVFGGQTHEATRHIRDYWYIVLDGGCVFYTTTENLTIIQKMG